MSVMEDPWSTPWAVDTPSPSPGLTPTKPKSATGASPLPGGGTITPTEEEVGIGGVPRSGEPLWDDATINGVSTGRATTTQQNTTRDEPNDDAWGAWDDGKQNAWTNENIDAGFSARREPGSLEESFSAPWGVVQTDSTGSEERMERVIDSAANFGEEPKATAESPLAVTAGNQAERNATLLLADEQNAWAEPQKEMTVAPKAADETTELPTAEETPDEDKELGPTKDMRSLDVKLEPSAGSPSDETQTQQQKASKVQVLVEMYDGIAKKGAQIPLEAAPREPKAPKEVVSAEVVDEDVAFQQLPATKSEGFEAGSNMDEEELDQQTVNIDEGKATSAEVTAVGDIPALTKPTHEDQGALTASPEKRGEVTGDEATSPSIIGDKPQQATSKSSKPPPYPIDLSYLDTLFPNTKASSVKPALVPDVIIDSSFTTTSERKTWYRIARFGSTRKHDSGDDDNYRRITWPSSKVRTETLAIVRRWMEQDTIAGRVVLGSRKSGPLGASMFNWDSSEPQIEISELLRQRVQDSTDARIGHIRNRSLQAPEEALPYTPTMGSLDGWSANGSPASTPATVLQSPSFAAPSTTKAAAGLRPPPDFSAVVPRSPWADDGKEDGFDSRSSTERMPPPPVPAINVLPTETSSNATKEETVPNKSNDADDDDDWGEMVSSQTVGSGATTFGSFSTPADIEPTKLQAAFDADFSGLEFFESPAPPQSIAAKSQSHPSSPMMISGASPSTQGAASPAWTPTMNSPALDDNMLLESMRPALAAESPTMPSTVNPEPARISLNSNRLSMDAWTPAASTPATDDRTSLNKNASTFETASTSTGAVTPSLGMGNKLPCSKRVSFEDACTVEQQALVDEALRSLPDLSYMLR